MHPAFSRGDRPVALPVFDATYPIPSLEGKRKRVLQQPHTCWTRFLFVPRSACPELVEGAGWVPGSPVRGPPQGDVLSGLQRPGPIFLSPPGSAAILAARPSRT